MAKVSVGDFEWDTEKAARNWRKHLISFAEAVTVFADPLFVIYYSSDHSSQDERYVIIGQSSRGRLLAVAYAEAKQQIRIISARRVTPGERRSYEESEEEY